MKPHYPTSTASSRRHPLCTAFIRLVLIGAASLGVLSPGMAHATAVWFVSFNVNPNAGTIQASPPNSPGFNPGEYIAGTQVTLTAVPNAGYGVLNWTSSAPITGLDSGNETRTSFQITVNTEAQITLNLKEVPAPSPSPSPSPTATPTPTPSPSPTATPIPSPTPIIEPTPSPSPTPFPSPSPSPSASPTPGPSASPTPSRKPTLQLGKRGVIDGKFSTQDSSFVLPGTSNNVDIVFWRFLGESKFRSFPVKGNDWTVRITGLKPGNNFLRFYGLNSETKQKTETANGNIVRSVR